MAFKEKGSRQNSGVRIENRARGSAPDRVLSQFGQSEGGILDSEQKRTAGLH